LSDFFFSLFPRRSLLWTSALHSFVDHLSGRILHPFVGLSPRIASGNPSSLVLPLNRNKDFLETSPTPVPSEPFGSPLFLFYSVLSPSSNNIKIVLVLSWSLEFSFSLYSESLFELLGRGTKELVSTTSSSFFFFELNPRFHSPIPFPFSS